MLYNLNLYNVKCQLYFDKVGEKKYTDQEISLLMWKWHQF